MGLDMWIEIETQRKRNEEELKSYKLRLSRTKAKLRRCEAKREKLIKTPFRYHSVVRPRKDLRDLAPRGG